MLDRNEREKHEEWLRDPFTQRLIKELEIAKNTSSMVCINPEVTGEKLQYFRALHQVSVNVLAVIKDGE